MDTKNGSPVGAPAPMAKEPSPVWHVAEPLIDFTEWDADAWRSAEVPEYVRRDLARVTGVRIREARGSMKRSDLAALLSVHENTLGKMERGESLPDAMQLLQVAALTGRSVLWLLGASGDASLSRQTLARPRGVIAVEEGNAVYVPLFDLRASAGHGAFNDDEQVIDMRPFTLDYVRRELHISHNELALVTVVGNSMEPDIHSGDVVLVDRRDKEISVEGPHLVRIDGALLVKLVQRRPGGILRVASKNPAYAPFDISVTDGDPQDFEVLGRVRWAGVTFR